MRQSSRTHLNTLPERELRHEAVTLPRACIDHRASRRHRAGHCRRGQRASGDIARTPGALMAQNPNPEGSEAVVSVRAKPQQDCIRMGAGDGAQHDGGMGTPFAVRNAAGSGRRQDRAKPETPIRAYHSSPYDFEKFDLS